MSNPTMASPLPAPTHHLTLWAALLACWLGLLAVGASLWPVVAQPTPMPTAASLTLVWLPPPGQETTPPSLDQLAVQLIELLPGSTLTPVSPNQLQAALAGLLPLLPESGPLPPLPTLITLSLPAGVSPDQLPRNFASLIAPWQLLPPPPTPSAVAAPSVAPWLHWSVGGALSLLWLALMAALARRDWQNWRTLWQLGASWPTLLRMAMPRPCLLIGLLLLGLGAGWWLATTPVSLASPLMPALGAGLLLAGSTLVMVTALALTTRHFFQVQPLSSTAR